MTFTFNEIKEAFTAMYGTLIYAEGFENFDDAFLDAWESFDYVAGAKTPEEFAEGMADGCWQLTEFGALC